VGKVRKLSESGIYHVYCRGNSRRVIFYDDDDRLMFCECLNNTSQKHNVVIYAYALMDNHFHLLIKAPNLSKFVSGLKISFIKRYYKKHYFTDSLCGSRFGSSVKDSGIMIKRSILYILCNPIKAGICNNINNYRWTSFNSTFLENGKHYDVKIDSSLAAFCFSNKEELEKEVNEAQLIKEHEIVEKDDNWYKISFFELNDLLRKLLAGRLLSMLTKSELFELKNELLTRTNASYFQIASLLNVSYRFVLYKSARRHL